jgi:Fe-S-cluster containining protein
MGRVITSDMCTKCGGCCRNCPFVALSTDEIGALSRFTGLEEAAFSESDRSAKPEKFLKFQKSGSCVFLKEEAGKYACSVYEARPGVCRSYPFTPTQEKVCETIFDKKFQFSGTYK